jgi:hypothetical protein
MTRRLTARALALATLATGLQAHAALYDPTVDWVDGSQSGPWSFGWDDGLGSYSFQAFDIYSRGLDSHTVGVDSQQWNKVGYQSFGGPGVYQNLSSNVWGGVPPGGMVLHPGPDGADTTGDAAVLRFTAPTTGSYTVNASFGDGDFGETLAWVLLDGNFTTPLAALGATSLNPSYSQTLTLTAGQTLDFMVGNAGDFFFDSTALAVTVSAPVPEPEGLALMLAGLGLLAGGHLRRSRGA